jgi:homospermidine synthase
MYLDTCNEPWAGGYSDPSQPANKRSNYAFREQALDVKKKIKANGPTALITHGANPGIVSHFVKQAVLNIARDTKTPHTRPKNRQEWAELMEKLGIKSIHISEKDTQAAQVIKHDQEFVNTWSIEGLVEEGKQPAELGWGTHEKSWPAEARRHPDGCQAAIYLDRPGALTKVRTWAPKAGPFHGWLITHTEAISIADYFTKKQGDKVLYRPTVHFAYHPSADAVMSMHEVI